MLFVSNIAIQHVHGILAHHMLLHARGILALYMLLHVRGIPALYFLLHAHGNLELYMLLHLRGILARHSCTPFLRWALGGILGRHSGAPFLRCNMPTASIKYCYVYIYKRKIYVLVICKPPNHLCCSLYHKSVFFQYRVRKHGDRFGTLKKNKHVLHQYRRCGYKTVSALKLWILGCSSTEVPDTGPLQYRAVDTGLVQYWICGFKSRFRFRYKNCESTGPVDTNLVLYRSRSFCTCPIPSLWI
jgi:hypothetical protein